jgi:CRISPR-associated protein Csm3
MKLTAIQKLTGVLELVSGLHIGSGNTEMHIGGTDNPVIKHPLTLEPYIPGSSIKGQDSQPPGMGIGRGQPTG